MELNEFLAQTQAEVRAEIGQRLGTLGDAYPYPESVFTELVMQHMADIGMTFDPIPCHYSAKVGNANLRLSGYAVSEEADQLDLFVSLYQGTDEIAPVSDTDTKTAAEQCVKFLGKCAEGRLASTMDETNDAYTLVLTIQECYANLDQIRIYVLTDRQAKAKNFKSREVNGKTVRLEVMDIERLHRHWSEGKPRDELVVSFEEVCGGALPCVYVPGEMSDYDYALTVFPGEALRFIYEKYGARLLEANVRSFLSAAGKVNKGIRDTLREAPERFMAYNNGIVVVADEARLGTTADGGPGILWLKGMQIVNGGQTTASMYFTKKKNPDVDLRRVRVPVKVIVLRSQDSAAEEALIADISRYANSQNSVKLSDLSANKPFHVELEKLALATYCPDGVSRWFYERAAGSYNVMLAREGTTPARLRKIKETIPTARKISKTDLAKYLNAWAQRPDLVSFGSQKNFERFMDTLAGEDGQPAVPLPDVTAFKQMIGKAILFKAVHRLVRPMFPAFQANIAAYTVALLSHLIGERVDFDRIWLEQSVSSQLLDQAKIWAHEVNEVLHRTANGRMISEWAKKQDCWAAVRDATYSPQIDGIPEVKQERTNRKSSSAAA
ncbi:MZA anti-phage system associated AIPR family protein MzaE [Microvirga sp. CF3062]|uniref:MZA anti-phage system associated AIPR family protein MzaE n=1 Tax=Microvirga sp. CF3062 TaxID=3110182 RepID=UPI002E781572|nr:MZA anti-phage system associated AIPR family protein MzaE [Microvirga sp. CF3062]MEE1656757.1 MZA anti-phage system associated AIPR family protein MzaE [Microvirga sp. CF3062]